MKFGLHISIAGGIENAPARALDSGCECFQIFSRSPHGGQGSAPDAVRAARFKEAMAAAGKMDCFIHSPYYINFASGNNRIYYGSISAIRSEMETADLLGARAVVTHLGSARDLGTEEAEKKLIAGLVKVFEPEAKPARHFESQLLLEITAGAGNIMGDTFEEIARFIARAEESIGQGKLGVCFDTAHAFASGYDLRSAEAVEETFQAFDQAIGLERIKLVHLNDSAVDLGAHVDRHANLGAGKIGSEGIRAVLQHLQPRQLDFVLETPPAAAGKDLKLLKGIRQELG